MIEYDVMPSLEHMALVKVTSTLWNQYDFDDLESQFTFPRTERSKKRNWQKWLKVEDKVLEKVSKLSLPERLKKKIICFVRPLGMQIGTWLNFCNRESCFASKLTINIHWTPRGTIDKKKMVELLVQDKNLAVVERFEIACTFCLEKHIYSLWPQLPKDHYKQQNSRVVDSNITFQISYWLHALRGELAQFANVVGSESLSLHDLAFWLSAIGGNEIATRYFLQKLTPAEREKSLVKTARHTSSNRRFVFKTKFFPDCYYSDILCFLLSIMTEEQCKQLIKSDPCSMLTCFFDWPWQDLFSKISQHLSTFSFPGDYHHLLMSIEDKITHGYKDYNYQEFFRISWRQVPSSEKENIIDLFIKGASLYELVKTKDEENIKLFLKDAAIVVEMENIFRGKGRKICENLMAFELWDLLKFFVQEYMLSKDMLMKLKEQINEGIVCTRGRKRQKCMFEKFLEIIDELIRNCSKRTNEDGKGYPAKRICSGKPEEANVEV